MPDAATHNDPPMSTRHPAEITEFVLDHLPVQGGGSACLRVTLAVNDPIVFDFVAFCQLRRPNVFGPFSFTGRTVK